MSILSLSGFAGEIPKLPADLLPATAAREAIDCDFAHGELRPMRGVFPLALASFAVRSAWSPDGLRFYAWPDDVDAVRSPVAGDQFKRLYFTTPSDFRVANYTMATATPAQPVSSYRVGVPAPSITVTAADPYAFPYKEPDHKFKLTSYFERNGVREESQTIDLTGANFLAIINAVGGLIRSKRAPTPLADEFLESRRPGHNGLVWQVEVFDSQDRLLTTAYSINSKSFSGNQPFAVAVVDDTPSNPAGTVTLRMTEANPDGYLIETRAYVATCVNTYGEESAPSAPVIVEVGEADKAAVKVTQPANGQYAPINKVRIYRTAPSLGETGYLLVKELIAGASGAMVGFSDDVKPAALSDLLPSDGWSLPDPLLIGLTQMPNGIFAAFKDNELHFSEAYRPHAWVADNILTFPHAIVGVVLHGSSLLVMTTAHPWLVSGASPDSMTQSRLPVEQALVNRRACVDTGEVIVFASNDGLVVVNGLSASLAQSQQFFTREDWRGRYGAKLSSLMLAYYDGLLIGAFPDADGFVIRLDESAPTYCRSVERFNGWLRLPQTDQLYVFQDTAIVQYGGGNPKPYSWHSPDFVRTSPYNYGALRYDGRGPATVEVLATIENGDGSTFIESQSLSLPGAGVYRLRSKFKSYRWAVKITGAAAVRSLVMAGSVKELVNV